jgi:hypothetical protein
VDYLRNYLKNIVQFMMHASQDQSEMVALEACEFWSALAETKVCKDVLREFIPRYAGDFALLTVKPCSSSIEQNGLL